METKFKNIEDVLPIGKTIIKVYPARQWDAETGTFDKYSHKRTRPNKAGISGYMYSTDVKYVDNNGKERRCNIFAYDKDKKELFDGGEVEANVVEYCVLEDGKTATKAEVEQRQLAVLLKQDENGMIVPATKKKVFYNKIRQRDITGVDGYTSQAECCDTQGYGDDGEPDYNDIPF
jgi:hypothetical protein